MCLNQWQAKNQIPPVVKLKRSKLLVDIELNTRYEVLCSIAESVETTAI
jgi:hypothetical protein